VSKSYKPLLSQRFGNQDGARGTIAAGSVGDVAVSTDLPGLLTAAKTGAQWVVDAA
jgi:hypothetical protein